MNATMVKRLVLKEWYFQRWTGALYVAGGMVSLAALAGKSNGMFYLATVLLLSVMIGIGATIAITAGVDERKEQTLPFLMTLPISPREYATAKLAANTSLFIVPWALLSLATLLMIGFSGGSGLTPYAAIVLTELLAAFCLVLSVAIVTESQGWTIGVMVATNLFLQGFLYYVSHLPSIGRTMIGKVAIWNATAIAFIAAEVALAALFLTITYFIQSRKTDFL
jgi:ABC-type transport system involved in multi-copper enzyme maturation permease subunit